MKISAQELTKLVAAVLQHAGAHEVMAQTTANALVLAESQGIGSHGLSRVNQYATHLRNGRVDGQAKPSVIKRKGGALLIDAKEGLAFEACQLAVTEAVLAANEFGVAFSSNFAQT